MSWLSGQFSTRVIALMPIAIVINIVLGYTVASILKLPIYLDSIGTILVGVLAGPIAGALTGILSNLIWQGVIPGQSIGPFAPVAGVIGLLAGLWGWMGVYRRRPAEGSNLWLPVIIAIGVVVLLAIPIVNNNTAYQVDFIVPWYTTAIVVVDALLIAAIVFLAYTRKDTAPAWVAVAGAVTGVIAAICSAPIATIVYGGVTGTGTDLIVAALRQGGADVFNAALGQGLFSDPIDKVITSFVVYVILTGLSPRLIARFPMGERAIGTAAA